MLLSSKNITRLFALAALALFAPHIHAQSTLSQNQDGFDGQTMDGYMNIEPGKDSTVVERTVSKDYYQWIIDRNTGLPVIIQPDTVQRSFQNVHLTEGIYGTYSHLGNMGSPRLSRLYFERKETPNFMFDVPYDSWIKDAADFRFTDTKSPHTTIDYYKGGNKRTGEEHIKGYFAANFNKQTGLGFDLDYLLGRGRYTNQATSMFDARVYSYYRGESYSIYGSVNRDQIKVAENGGIQDMRYILNPEAMAEGRKQYEAEDIPFRLYSNWNNIQRLQAIVNQSLSLKSYASHTDSIGDTVLTFVDEIEYAKVAHTFEIGDLKRRYIYYKTTPGFYPTTYLNNDSIDLLRNFYVTNTVSFSLLEGFNKWALASLSAYARYEYRQFYMPDTLSTGRATEYQRKYKEGNFSIGAQMEKASGDNLTFKLNAQTVLLGADIGDFTLNGDMELKYPVLGKEAKIGANATMSALNPAFFMQSMHSTFAWWDNDFNKEFKTRIGGYIEFEKTRTKLQLDVENVVGYVYLRNDAGGYINDDGVSQPMYSISAHQDNGAIQVLSASLTQNFKLGPLHWDNNITYQLSGNKTIIPLPDLNIFTDLYFKFVYYKRLHIEAGANALFFTRYNAPGYSPAAGMYHLQNQGFIQQVGGYPLLTGYINCQLRGVRFYVLYYHANYGMMGNNDFFIVPGYPANPSMFKFGLSWRLYD